MVRADSDKYQVYMYLGQIDLLLDLLGWISNTDSVLKLELIYMSLGKGFMKYFPFALNTFSYQQSLQNLR